MRADARVLTRTLALGATLAGIGYTAFALSRLRAFRRRVRDRTAPLRRPSVTILKPVRGSEPSLEEKLRSFCAQDYPEFDVIFGVRERDDPALDVIRRLAAAYPDRTTVVIGDDRDEKSVTNGVHPPRYRNPKIDTLAPMLPDARNDVLVIADSDMRVDPLYLDAVVAAFADECVGAVTCIYSGEPTGSGLASVLGAMWITEQFAPSALVANALEPLTYCFGATMAVRRDVFDAIGGLAALGDQLADDHALGRLVTGRGWRVELAPYVVANTVSESGLQALLLHELRWARTIRTVRPKSYAGILLTYPLPLALLYAALANGGQRALPVVVLAAFTRLAMHCEAYRALGTRRRPSPLLIPLRDALGVAVWIAGLIGRSVRWRDAAYRIAASGKLINP